jgi:hypothetical protein
MGKFFKLVKSFKDSPSKKIQQLKERYQELDDLSEVAIEIGNSAIYKSLQTEMKEVFFDYLSITAAASIYKLVPHVFIIWLIGLKWQSLTVPLINKRISILGAYLLSYLIFHLGQILAKLIKSGLSPKLGLADIADHQCQPKFN